MTAKARVLLTSLATDMELPAAEFDEAMAILQKGEALAAKADDPQRTRFRSFLKRQLEELKAGILSARHEQTLMHFAVSQLGMAEDAAREDLLAVAAEVGLRRVPLEEALRYVEGLVAQKIGDEAMVDSSDVKRLYTLARDWGLEPSDVDDLVRYRLEDNVARQRREQWWNKGVIAGGVGAIALVVLIILAIIWRNSTRRGPDQAVIGKTGVGTTDPGSEPRTTKPPAWWDADLTIAISLARNEREGFGPVYDALIADDPQRRSQGYELLLDRAASAPFDIRNWKLHEPVLIGCYALEPDDGAADKLRQLWLAVPQRAIDTIPATTEEYQAAIRPVTSAVKAIKDNRVPEARRQALSDDLGRMLHVPLNPSVPEAEFLKESLGSLALVLLERLAEGIEKRPDLLGRHYSVLTALARDRASPEDLSNLDAVVASAAIKHANENWRSWEAILHRGIESRDALAVLRIVDAYESCPSGDLKKELEKRLFARLGISAAGLPSSRYADAMRKALGASLPVDTSDAGRWTRLAPRAADALAEARRSNDPAVSLKSTVNLAWHVNLAMALALPRPNPGQFDRWLADGPSWERMPDEEGPPATAAPTLGGGERLSRDQQETFDRYLHELGDWQKLDEPRRASYLRAIGQTANKVSDLTAVQARHLASYLLGQKREQEQTFVLDNVNPLRWRQLKIALADGIERSQLPPDQLRRLVIAFSGQEVVDIDKNRDVARRLLLKSVVDELSMAPSGTAASEASSDVDRWAGELAAVYRQRAQLLGASPAELDSLTSASSLLRPTVTRLPGASAAGDTAPRLADAADALGSSDAQRCVVLQRSSIERLLTEFQRRQPERRPEARQLLERFQKETVASKQVLAQLQAGEATLLELWMLARPKG